MDKGNIKMNVSICKIIRQYLTDDEIEKIYQDACNKFLHGESHNPNLMERVTAECRNIALKQIPKSTFTVGQLLFIQKEWGIEV